MSAGHYNSTHCGGAIYEFTDMGDIAPDGSGNPGWVIGAAFLKNVYSVYRLNPPSVGFAQVASPVETRASPFPPWFE